jgi:hypothetical protein
VPTACWVGSIRTFNEVRLGCHTPGRCCAQYAPVVADPSRKRRQPPHQGQPKREHPTHNDDGDKAHASEGLALNVGDAAARLKGVTEVEPWPNGDGAQREVGITVAEGKFLSVKKRVESRTKEEATVGPGLVTETDKGVRLAHDWA